jgi:hypothetical protein
VETGAISTASPAKHFPKQEVTPSNERKARCWRAFVIRHRSLNSQIGELAGRSEKSLRRLPRIFPFSGDFHRRLGSISTACGWRESISSASPTVRGVPWVISSSVRRPVAKFPIFANFLSRINPHNRNHQICKKGRLLLFRKPGRNNIHELFLFHDRGGNQKTEVRVEVSEVMEGVSSQTN